VAPSTLSRKPPGALLTSTRGRVRFPLPVLERIREELLDWHGSACSVMEMSHARLIRKHHRRGGTKLRSLLGISDDYAVIFLQGGGSMQFTMAPMNLCLPGKPVDVLHTGNVDRESRSAN